MTEPEIKDTTLRNAGWIKQSGSTTFDPPWRLLSVSFFNCLVSK